MQQISSAGCSVLLLVLLLLLLSADRPLALPSTSLHYGRLELGTFPVAATAAAVAAAGGDGAGGNFGGASGHLTLMQVYDCVTRLETECRRGGYDDLLRLSSPGSDWELDSDLLSLLRVALFRAHSTDQPDERLAVCFIVQTPNIFDQWKPRSDPVCVTLAGSKFHLQTNVLAAQRILCLPEPENFSRVFAVCSGPALASSISTQPPPAATLRLHRDMPDGGTQQQGDDSLSPVVIASSSTIGISRLACALIWTLAIALSAVAILVAGAMVNSALRRRGVISDSAAAAATSASDAKASPALIAVTAGTAEALLDSADELECGQCDYVGLRGQTKIFESEM